MSLRTASLIFAVAAALFGACGSDAEPPPPSPTPTQTGAAGTPASETPTPTPATTEVAFELDEWVIRPSTLRAPPGTVIFRVRNAGSFPHQFVIARTDLGPGRLPVLPGEEGVDESQLEIVGRIEEIAPGETRELILELEPASYVIFDNLSNGDSFYLNGMYTRFTIGHQAELPVFTIPPLPTPQRTLEPTPEVSPQ